MTALDPFYPIFDSADWLERMVPLGIRLVQLRVKDKADAQLRAEIRAARDICAAHDCQLIVNDYWKLALDEGCDFIHLGQEDLDGADLDRALSVRPNYIALGPIYPTILKKMKWHEQGLPRLGEWKARIGNIPLVGIGGLSVERAPGVFAAGADIVSVVTDITLHADPAARVREWIAVTRPFVA
ncbi:MULTISPECIES: thiamine phosphate synthase [unclassified Brucella]|uniref:thiamine phosphate synthase n=1 Tax=unclassified Brucella TaxID=2632610 RepID=UPI000D029CC2|nr:MULTISPECIES: thiamine phosphate synthase [unclassified Brucella]